MRGSGRSRVRTRWNCLYTWDSGFIGLGLLELGRQIVKVLPQKQHDLLHVQPEIRDLLPRGQAIGGEILFPAPQLAHDKVIVEFHKLTHTFRNQYSTSRAKCNEYLYWKTN